MRIIKRSLLLFFSWTTSMLTTVFSSFNISDFTTWVCDKIQQQSGVFNGGCDFLQNGIICYFLYGFLLMPLSYFLITRMVSNSINFNDKKYHVKRRLFMRSCYYLLVYIISVSIMSLAIVILMNLLPIDLIFDDIYETFDKQSGWYSDGVYNFNPLFADFLIFVHTILPLSLCYAVSKTLRGNIVKCSLP